VLGRNKVVKNDVACPFCIIHHTDVYHALILFVSSNIDIFFINGIFLVT
jgi:hypothetical protein